MESQDKIIQESAKLSISKSEPSQDKGIHFTVQFESCRCEVVVATQIWGNSLKKIFSVPIIESKEQRKGHAGKMIKHLEGLAKQRRCNEIWYPTIINPILNQMLLNRGYEYSSFGKHPAIGEEVFGMKKVLQTKERKGSP